MTKVHTCFKKKFQRQMSSYRPSGGQLYQAGGHLRLWRNFVLSCQVLYLTQDTPKKIVNLEENKINHLLGRSQTLHLCPSMRVSGSLWDISLYVCEFSLCTLCSHNKKSTKDYICGSLWSISVFLRFIILVQACFSESLTNKNQWTYRLWNVFTVLHCHYSFWISGA